MEAWNLKSTGVRFVSFAALAGLLMLGACAPASSEKASIRLKVVSPEGRDIYQSKHSLFKPQAEALSSDYCYALLISASDHPSLNRIPTNIDTSKPECANRPQSVGIVSGLHQVGDEITLEVPTGAGRRFDLVAMEKADSDPSKVLPQDCKALLNVEAIFEDGKLSPTPFINGTRIDKTSRIIATGTTSIASGVINEVLLTRLSGEGISIDCDSEPQILSFESQSPFSNISEVSFNISASNSSQMYLTYDSTCNSGGTWEPYNSEKLGFTIPPAKYDQSITVYLKTKSLGGTESTCVASNVFIHDSIIPAPATISGSNPLIINDANKSNVNISGGCEANGTVAIRNRPLANPDTIVPCSTGGTWTDTFDMSSAADSNTYTFNIVAIDAAGNEASASPLNVIKDTIGPTLTFVPTYTLTNDSKPAFQVSGTCETSGSTIQFFANATLIGTSSCAGGNYSTFLNMSTFVLGSNITVNMVQGDANGNTTSLPTSLPSFDTLIAPSGNFSTNAISSMTGSTSLIVNFTNYDSIAALTSGSLIINYSGGTACPTPSITSVGSAPNLSATITFTGCTGNGSVTLSGIVSGAAVKGNAPNLTATFTTAKTFLVDNAGPSQSGSIGLSAMSNWDHVHRTPVINISGLTFNEPVVASYIGLSATPSSASYMPFTSVPLIYNSHFQNWSGSKLPHTGTVYVVLKVKDALNNETYLNTSFSMTMPSLPVISKVFPKAVSPFGGTLQIIGTGLNPTVGVSGLQEHAIKIEGQTCTGIVKNSVSIHCTYPPLPNNSATWINLEYTYNGAIVYSAAHSQIPEITWAHNNSHPTFNPVGGNPRNLASGVGHGTPAAAFATKWILEDEKRYYFEIKYLAPGAGTRLGIAAAPYDNAPPQYFTLDNHLGVSDYSIGFIESGYFQQNNNLPDPGGTAWIANETLGFFMDTQGSGVQFKAFQGGTTSFSTPLVSYNYKYSPAISVSSGVSAQVLGNFGETPFQFPLFDAVKAYAWNGSALPTIWNQEDKAGTILINGTNLPSDLLTHKNLRALQSTNTAYEGIRATRSKYHGYWMWRVKLNNTSCATCNLRIGVGIARYDQPLSASLPGADSKSFVFVNDGTYQFNGASGLSSNTPFTNGDTVIIYLNAQNGMTSIFNETTGSFFNGSISIASMNADTSSASGGYFPYVVNMDTGANITNLMDVTADFSTPFSRAGWEQYIPFDLEGGEEY